MPLSIFMIVAHRMLQQIESMCVREGEGVSETFTWIKQQKTFVDPINNQKLHTHTHTRTYALYA